MFKSVEFVGFEARPDLKPLAERATEVLGTLVRTWRDDIEVTWRPATPGARGVLELTLALALWNAAGSATGSIRARAFEPGEESLLRIDLRFVLLDLFGELSRQQMVRLEDFEFEPAEA